MLSEIIKQVNWVDIFVIILFVRISYVSLKNGFCVEIFKILGTLSAIYFSLHYYNALADSIAIRPGLKSLPSAPLAFVSFILLSILGYSVFALLQKLFARFLKLEAKARLNKWGAFTLGLARSLLFSGFLVFALALSGIGYFKHSVAASYSGGKIIKVAPLAYSLLWKGLISKFRPQEEFNASVWEAQKGQD